MYEKEMMEMYKLARKITGNESMEATDSERERRTLKAIKEFERAYELTCPNTKIEFLYRDASNYKSYNTVILSGVLSEEQIDQIIDSLSEGEYFIPEQVGLPVERFSQITEDDHCWCELEKAGITRTMQPPTEMISANDVYNAFRKSKNHWDDVKYAIA